MITHYDLFAGIGGFSLALEEVFDEAIRHIFCEWEEFPTQVLKKHWPEGIYYGDIKDLVADTASQGRENTRNNTEGRHAISNQTHENQEQGLTILTGGFPCQPFSAAGKRRGTADDRYQWPNMFEVIRNTKPDWVIAENVRGLTTWNEGMVLEQVCTDLEIEGYEVQPIIIPAVAVNAPHRRDRVWIIAHSLRDTDSGTLTGVNEKENGLPQEHRQERSKSGESIRATELGSERTSDGLQDSGGLPEGIRPFGDYTGDKHENGSITYTRRKRRSEGSSEGVRPSSQESKRQNREYPDWERNWQEVAFATCDDGMDDGLSRDVGGVSYSRAKWRKEALKAYGNAIVPQVAMQIFQAIKEAEGIA